MAPVGLSRRRALQLGLGSLALATLPGRARAQPVVRRPPRYFVLVFLRGGIDAVLTTDPRRPGEVEAGIDLPYAADQIAEQGKLRVGPHFRRLLPSVPELTILNGVRAYTANHETGAAQVARLRTGTVPAMPGICDLIGERRDGQPLGCVALGGFHELEHSPRWFQGEQLRALVAMPADERALLGRTLRRHAERMGKPDSLSTAARNSQQNLLDTSAFIDRLAAVPAFAEVEWSPLTYYQDIARQMQHTLWLLEQDLTRTVYLKLDLGWDTHERNLVKQGNQNEAFVEFMGRFMRELGGRQNAHGRIADLTRFVLTSEVGRYPRLNRDLGKDHFPEHPVMVLGGPGPAVYGRTGRRMESLPISPSTGLAPGKGLAGHPVSLDDVGATVLTAFGVRPRTHGYTGRVLDFLGLA
jgi:hypothetical protein